MPAGGELHAGIQRIIFNLYSNMIRDPPQGTFVPARQPVHSGIIAESVLLEAGRLTSAKIVSLQDGDIRPLLGQQAGDTRTAYPRPNDHYLLSLQILSHFTPPMYRFNLTCR